MGTGITNFVSMDIMANLLLAAGASPAMVRLTSHYNRFPAYPLSTWTPHSHHAQCLYHQSPKVEVPGCFSPELSFACSPA